MRFAPCVRSGMCCKIATCAAGVSHGASQRGCEFLKGDGPGEYECDLVRLRPELADPDRPGGQAITIGAGCGSTMFNRDRDRVIFTKEKKGLHHERAENDERAD